jgi:hypothetical protein
MKTKTISLIIFLFAIFSCCSDADLSSLPSKIIIKGPAVSIKQWNTSVLETGFARNLDTVMVTLFIGDSIEWFNETTGELRFKGGSVAPEYFVISFDFYIDSLFLFNLVSTGTIYSWVINRPVLCWYGSNSDFHPAGEYIEIGYPNWSEEYLGKDSPDMIERRKNWEAIKPGWDLFIKQLKKEGKYRK